MKKLELVSGNLSISINAELNEQNIPVLQVGRIPDGNKVDLNTGEKYVANTNDDILSIEFLTIEGVEVWLRNLYSIHEYLLNKV